MIKTRKLDSTDCHEVASAYLVIEDGAEIGIVWQTEVRTHVMGGSLSVGQTVRKVWKFTTKTELGTFPSIGAPKHQTGDRTKARAIEQLQKELAR